MYQPSKRTQQDRTPPAEIPPGWIPLWFSAMVLLVASILPLYLASAHHILLNDDTYITLTYAKNLATGNGFVYNQPPATLGTTTPFLVILIASLAQVFPQVEAATLAVYLTAVCWIGVAWTFFLFRMEWQIDAWQAVTIGLVIFTTNWIIFLGMEAYLFAFLLVATFTLFLRQRYVLTGIFTGLLFLTRGEGVLILLLLLAISILFGSAFPKWHWRESLYQIVISGLHRGQPWLILAGFCLPLILWSIYALQTFNVILPNTLDAKQAQLANGFGRDFVARLLKEWLPLWGIEYRIAGSPFLNLWWPLVLAGIIIAVLHCQRWLLFLVWVFVYTVGYSLLGISAYWWYQLPIHFVLQLFLGLGIAGLVGWVGRSIQMRGAAVIVTLALTVFALMPQTISVLAAARNFAGDPRGDEYIALGEWFSKHTAAEQSIAFIEIGYLGYFTPNKIIDLAGLTQPDIVPHVSEGDFAWGFWQYQPDYFVYSEVFDWAIGSIYVNPEFDATYTLIETLPGPYGDSLHIYERTVP